MISIEPLPPKVRIPKQRVKSAKYMTIVFGMLQPDGVVLAADTELTGHLMRQSVPKLFSYRRDSGERLVIGGAGPEFSVKTLEQRLGKSFEADSSSFEQTAQTIIKQFYDEYVASQPTLEEKLEYDFWLLLGLSTKTEDNRFEHSLWISESGSLREAEYLEAIGAGAEIARLLLHRYRGAYPLPVAEMLAIHFLRLVKEQAHYCGKESMVWSVTGPGVRRMPAQLAERAEDLSIRFDQVCKDTLIATLCGALPGSGRASGEHHLSLAGAAFVELKNDYILLVDELEAAHKYFGTDF